MVPCEKLVRARDGDNSATMRERVGAARARQAHRFRDSPTRHNGMMTPMEIETHGALTPEGLETLRRATIPIVIPTLLTWCASAMTLPT